MPSSERINIDGLAHGIAGRCDGCGHDAVELCTWLEDDGGSGQRLSYCRPCMGDDADDPSNEWIVGETVAPRWCPVCESGQVGYCDERCESRTPNGQPGHFPGQLVNVMRNAPSVDAAVLQAERVRAWRRFDDCPRCGLFVPCERHAEA